MIAVDDQWMISGWWMIAVDESADGSTGHPFFLSASVSQWIPASWAGYVTRHALSHQRLRFQYFNLDLDLFIRQLPSELYKSRGSPRGSWSWYMPSWLVSARHHPTSGEWIKHWNHWRECTSSGYITHLPVISPWHSSNPQKHRQYSTM